LLDVATARELTPGEEQQVREWFQPPISELFFAQPPADQRHGYEAATSLEPEGAAADLIVAALVHDIGKRHSRLGVIGRSLASVAIKLRLPLSERMRAYRDHGIIGAHELAMAGAPSLAVDFALHHHGARPESISEPVWDLLNRADEPPKPTETVRGWIMSRNR
jgi:hypothetical protein